MKKLTLLAALSGFAATQADIIEDTIKDHDYDTLKIVLAVGSTNNAYSVTKEQKDHYVALAQQQVEKCTAKCSKLCPFDSVTGIDWLSIAAFTASTASGSILMYDAFYSKKEDKHIQSITGFGVFCYGLSNTLKSIKDLMKHINEHRTKNKENFKKSERILALIGSLPVQA